MFYVCISYRPFTKVPVILHFCLSSILNYMFCENTCSSVIPEKYSICR